MKKIEKVGLAGIFIILSGLAAAVICSVAENEYVNVIAYITIAIEFIMTIGFTFWGKGD